MENGSHCGRNCREMGRLGMGRKTCRTYLLVSSHLRRSILWVDFWPLEFQWINSLPVEMKKAEGKEDTGEREWAEFEGFVGWWRFPADCWKRRYGAQETWFQNENPAQESSRLNSFLYAPSESWVVDFLFELCTQSGHCDVNSISVNPGFSWPKPLGIQSHVIVITQGNVAV